ncbi:hypothetical protein PAXINDRAFT_177403 [Paxillus involutus ATCC 200175]|uniref:Beta-lactamase-related domain-containing protein n=1 Tax=Paxillus involutus ATCC 200175 TaxID=664439 RepID=A0A0C9TT34_PAXIN|nr:hypothetical protein PAXINDRAFT_177403 [Paxillus involutus ATCC 200175]
MEFYLHGGSVITPALSTFIEETLAAENITGLSVAVVPQHGTPEFHTWGYRTEDGDEMTPDTLFHMASISKAFCATALGLLIDDFAKHDYSYGPSDTPHDAVTRLRYLRPAFELREQWSYNNIMFMVGAHIITTYTDQPYTSFVEERIFSPLGMTSSTFSPNKAEASGKFTRGWAKDGRRIPEWFTEDTAFLKAGPGGIISTAIDMSKWISTWLNEGVQGDKTVIPPYVYRNVSYSYSVSTDHPTDSEHSITGYGMGWFRSSYRGHDVVYHSGAIPGFSTLFSFLPSDELGITVFANGGDKARPVMRILNRILDQALHLNDSLTLLSPVDSSPPKPTAKPSTWNLTLSPDDFAGTYTNPGYGAFTLCSASSASSYCAKVRSDFAAVDYVQGDPGPRLELLAEWPRVWSSHVRLRYQQGSIFEIDFTSLFPNGYGKDTTPFETGESGTAEGTAEFVIEDGEVVGFGISGLVGRLTERGRIYQNVRDRAEVWFDRV